MFCSGLKKTLICILMLLSANVLQAQYIEPAEHKAEEAEHKPSIFQRLHNFLRDTELKGLDTNYIGAPKRKWSAYLNTYTSDVAFRVKSKEIPELGRIRISMHSKVQNQVSAGLFYYGYGASYSWSLIKGYNKDLSFTTYSSPVGGEVRYHTSKAISGTISAQNLPKELKILRGDAKETTFILNTYYLFNRRKFSYGAAMSYSKIQKRSAGSPMAGLTLYQTRITSYDPLLTSMLGGIKRIKLRQWGIGGGYAYNWVVMNSDEKNLLLHASLMPMILFTAKSVARSESGEWVVKEGTFGQKNNTTLTFMARGSVSYNWSERYLTGISGFYNTFRVGSRNSYHASTDDWVVRVFFAVRF